MKAKKKTCRDCDAQRRNTGSGEPHEYLAEIQFGRQGLQHTPYLCLICNETLFRRKVGEGHRWL